MKLNFKYDNFAHETTEECESVEWITFKDDEDTLREELHRYLETDQNTCSHFHNGPDEAAFIIISEAKREFAAEIAATYGFRLEFNDDEFTDEHPDGTLT